MKIIRNNIIPFPGFRAINLFGVLFVRGDAEVNEVTLRHEEIHTRQMKDLLYIPFYVLYFLEWLFLLLRYFNFHKAYRAISFEREAYGNQFNPDYLQNRQ